MSETTKLFLVVIITPFLSFVIMFMTLVISNAIKGSTAEVRLTFPPLFFLRIITVILVVIVVFILTYLKTMEVSVASAILGSVVTGIIATTNKKEDTN